MILEIIGALIVAFAMWILGFLTGHARGKVDAYEEGHAVISETPEEDPR